jgi:membrane-associated phospholipid phosphatase
MCARLHKLRRPALIGFALVLCRPEAVPAQQLAPRYDVRPVPALAVSGGTTAVWLAAHVFRDRLPYATCAPCDPRGLPAIDRGTVGPRRDGPGVASDVTLGVAVLGSALLLASSGGDGAARREDLAVWYQAVTMTAALTAWGKVLVRRPRPNRYVDSSAAGLRPDDGLSFPSGHASVAFAAATAYASILYHRDGARRSQRAATTVLLGAAASTAVLRVAARRHFPTDVIAGAALGAAVGWLVPAAYPMR